MRRIASHLLLDRGRVVRRPVVTVDDDGRILSVGQWERLDGDAATEFYAGALCAGFVNAHCHLELSYLRGAIARGSGFAGFHQGKHFKKFVESSCSSRENNQSFCKKEKPKLAH